MFASLPNTLRKQVAELLPGTCLLCNLPAGRAQDLCRYCEASLPLNRLCCSVCAEPFAKLTVTPPLCGHCQASPPAFTVTVAPWLYLSPVSHLLNRFKQHGNLACASVLLEKLEHGIGQQYSANQLPDALLPVPLHWKKRWQRGFNQSLWLARKLSRQLAIPALNNGVMRNRPTVSQQRLKRKQRQQNLRGCFSVRKPVDGMHLAIVDDVMTTGSTANELAATLIKSGATRVDVWCLARTPVEK